MSRAVTHFLTRLDPNYGTDASVAGKILDKVATAPASMRIVDLLTTFGDVHRVLDFLIDDHYLTRAGSTIHWRYDILRRIWVQRRYLDVS